MQNNIWGRRTETGHTGEEFREEVQLHLSRALGEPHVAFSDQDGWAGKSKEPGPPIDVMVIPPEGERRFAYVCTYGSSLKKGGDALSAGGKTRMEFVLATPQKGDPKADLAMLNLAANTVRQFAKLVHIQSVRVAAGETVQFSKNPKPMFDDSKQVAFAFMRPRLPADGFDRMRLSDGEAVDFWAPVPIYRDELEAASAHGPSKLAKALDKAGITEMLHLDRPSVARKAYGLRRTVVSKIRNFFRRD
jgi:Suppressor of fused protein (SUFU)